MGRHVTYRRLQQTAMATGIILMLLNGFTMAYFGITPVRAVFFLLGFVVVLLRGDLAGKHR